MKTIKKVLVLIIMAFVSVVSFTACGDPYKNMTLIIDDGGFEDALDRRYEYNPNGSTFDITAIVDGAGKNVSTAVVFESQDKNVISASEEAVSDGNKNTQTFDIKGVGETYITVTTVEGNFSQNIKVSIFAQPQALNFINTTVPIIKGSSVDLTKQSKVYSQAPIQFSPVYATERNVKYEVYADEHGLDKIYEGETYTTDGNVLNISKNTDRTDLYIKAISENGVSTRLTHFKLLNEINVNELGLSYTYTQRDTGLTDKDFFEVDRSTESGVDFQIYLADQFDADDDRSAKNIYLTTGEGDDISIVEDYTLTLLDKSSDNHFDIFKNEVSRPSGDIDKFYNICNGNGEGNTEIVYFNINYAGFEDFFVGQEIAMRVTIDAFPSDIVIAQSDKIDDIEESQEMMIYNNYFNSFGTPFYVKILNKAGQLLKNQYAYVNVWDVNTNMNASSRYFTLFNEDGEVVTSTTKVRSGSLIFIRYNAQTTSSGEGISYSKPIGNFVLYAYSAIEKSVTSLEDINGDEAYEFNNLKLAAINYQVSAEDITITLTGEEKDMLADIEFLTSKEVADYPNINDYVVELTKNDFVELGFDDNYYVKALDNDKLGVTTLTIVAPNGSSTIININVTKNPQTSNFAIKVGNTIINNGDLVTINMNVSSRQIITMIVDGIQYTTMPYGYRFNCVIPGGETSSIIENDSVLVSKSETNNKVDEYSFHITYIGSATPVAIFTLRVRVIKPVNYISKSNPLVEMLYNNLTIIKDQSIDENVVLNGTDYVEGAYTDISEKTKSTITYTFNPSGATIDHTKLSFDFKYSNNWVRIEGLEEVMNGEFLDYMHGTWAYEDEYETVNGYKLNIVFDIKISIVENKVIIELENISTNKTEEIKFVIRIGYSQYYNLSTIKDYYIGYVEDVDGLKHYYIYTNRNNPDGSRVLYIGGNKINEENFIFNDSDEISAIVIAGVEFPVEGLDGTEVRTFTYDSYKIDMYSQIDYSVKNPITTNSISLVGVNYNNVVQNYYIGNNNGSYYIYTDLQNEYGSTITKINGYNITQRSFTVMNGKLSRVKVGANSFNVFNVEEEKEKTFNVVTDDGLEFYLVDYFGNRVNNINGYEITQENFTIELGVCTQFTLGNTIYEVLTDGLNYYFSMNVYEKVPYISYTSNVLNYYSKTVNKNELESMDTVTYYIGSVGEGEEITYFLYTNINKPNESKVSYIGSYEINNNCFVDAVGDYLKNASGNRIVQLGSNSFIVNSETIKGQEVYSINITTFKIYYKTTPQNSEIKGMLFRHKIGDTYDIISKFVYDNGKVIGASTKLNFSDANGLIITVDYSSDYIEFQILDNAKFEKLLTDFSYVLDLEFVTVDSAKYDGDALNFTTFTTFKLMLATGTQDNPYLIDDAESFMAINNALDAYYKVIQNISLFNIKSWTPIGTELEPFTGVIYADKKYTISDFYFDFNYTLNNNYYGLFGVFNGTLRNLDFKNFKTTLTITEALHISDNINIYLGSVAGVFNGIIENCTFIDDESTNYDTYPVNNISNTSPYGVMLINDYDVTWSWPKDEMGNDIVFSDTNPSIYYNVGGVFGAFITLRETSKTLADNISASAKVYVSTTNSLNQVAYIGGLAGYANQLRLDNATIYSVIYYDGENKESRVGGVLGNEKLSTIDNANITTYIDAYNNVGGVIGYAEQAYVEEIRAEDGSVTDVTYFDTVYNTTVIPFILANDNVGGVIGYNEGRNILDSIKVQFIDRSSNGFSYENSSIIANNYIGGVVGYSKLDININYTSVMSYVNGDISLLGSANEVMSDRQRYLGDIISTYNNATFGGFVGISTSLIYIENSYFNASAMAYGTPDGPSYFGGLIGAITDNIKTFGAGRKFFIGYTSVEGKFYHLSDGIVIGGFIGSIPQGLKSTNGITSGLVDLDDQFSVGSETYFTYDEFYYDIENSYTVLQYTKMSDVNLQYIDNFVGANERCEVSQIYEDIDITMEFLSVNVEYVGLSGATHTFKITYTTIEGVVEKIYTTNNSSIININFGKLPLGTTTGAGWNTRSSQNDDAILSFALEENNVASYSYKDKIIVNHLNLAVANSFYIGFETKVNVYTTDSDSYYLNIRFTEAGARSEYVDISDGAKTYRFNYYTLRAYSYNPATSLWEIEHFAHFDNLSQESCFAGDNDISYILNITFPDDGTDGNITYEQTLTKGSVITDAINNDPNNIYYITSKLNIANRSGFENNRFKNNFTYIVKEGTKLNGHTNLEVYGAGYQFYFNNTVDNGKYNVLNGFPVPFANSEILSEEQLNGDIPKLIIDIQPVGMDVEVKEDYRPEVNKKQTIILPYFALTAKQQNRYNELISKNNLTFDEVIELEEFERIINSNLSENSKILANLLDIVVIPEIASGDVIYETSNRNVFTISSGNIIIVGEGVATLTVKSKLNTELYQEIDVVVVGFDFNNIIWEIQSANSEKIIDTEVNIVANDGDLLTSDIGYEGSTTFGIRYEFNINQIKNVEANGKTVQQFIQSLNISGYNIADYVDAEGNVVINIDGLNHTVFCGVLGTIENVRETLYFKYSIRGVENCKYFDYEVKNITYNFTEGLFGIDGSDELNFVAINRDSFSVVLESDSENFDISFVATLNNLTSSTFEDISVGTEIFFEDVVGGYLTISLDSINYDKDTKLKTYTFSAYVLEEQQPLVSEVLNYTLNFFTLNHLGEQLTHTVNINILPQEVDNVYINHYTNVLFSVNSEPNIGNEGGYKYPSEVIIPGYPSLLQIDIFPSFGRYDYITVESNLKGIVFSQVVEVLNMDGLSNQYSWYESYAINQSTTQNGVQVKNKFSYKDYSRLPEDRLGYNGSIYLSLSADNNLSDAIVTITVKGYLNGVSEEVFTQTCELKVEARPSIELTSDSDEFKFGDQIDLGIKVAYTDSGFTASLKAEGEDAEYIGTLGDVVFNPERGSYVLLIKDNYYTYTIFHEFMYRKFNLSLTVTKYINGMLTEDTSTKDFILVPFTVNSIDLNLGGVSKTQHQVIVDYYQLYDLKVTVNADYSNGYAEWLRVNQSHNNMLKQIDSLNSQIASQIANYSVIKKGTSSLKVGLLSSSQSVYQGEFFLEFNQTHFSTMIRFIATEINDFVWAEVGINYTIYGIEVGSAEASEFSFSDYIDVIVDTASDDDRPEPITSVKQLREMREGVSYILMKDLYLSNWEPIDANFTTFDGNGYVLTVNSFADVSKIQEESVGNINIGIFKEIKEGSVVKNLTIEINPSLVAVNHTELDYENETYDDLVNAAIRSDGVLASTKSSSSEPLVYGTKLFVDVRDENLKEINFGMLAGTNNGTITNISIVNNATDLRAKRDVALEKIYNRNYGLKINYGDNFKESIDAFKDVNGVDTVKVSYLYAGSTDATSRNNRIALLVGTNNGYITNSSAENVSVEGEDFIAGLVSYNLGKISSSYFKGGNIVGDTEVKANSGCGGLVSVNDTNGEIYYSFVRGREKSSDITGLNKNEYLDYEYSGSGIITGNYAGGFVYENKGKINNSYARIFVSGNNTAGFAYRNEVAPSEGNEGSVIEYCYAYSSIKKGSTASFPFTSKFKGNTSTLSEGIITDCFYLSDPEVSTNNSDAAVGIAENDFTDYAAFIGYAFNVDYINNQEILDGAWFINSGTVAEQVLTRYFKTTDVVEGSPELVNANQRTMSVRYLVSAEESTAAYNYSYVQEINVSSNTSKESAEDIMVSINRGAVNNPILISSAENFNKQVVSKGTSENRNFRFIKDITFTQGDEVATTYNATFSGKLDGNGMNIEELRISADSVETGDGLSRLGLFAKIEGFKKETVDESETIFFDSISYMTSYAVVKNLNITIAQIDGVAVNMVGVLAGEIENGKIYNITVSGENFTVQGLNAVGGIAGRIKGDTDLVNISSNVSVKANAYTEPNAFSSEVGDVDRVQSFSVYRNYTKEKINNILRLLGYVDITYDNISNEIINLTKEIEKTTNSQQKLVLEKRKNELDEILKLSGDNIKDVSYAGGIVGICENNKFEILQDIETDDDSEGDKKRVSQIRENMYRSRRLYTMGNVTITGEVVGGIFGHMSMSSNMSDCEILVYDNMSLKGSRIAGGLIGHNEGDIKRCYVENVNQQEIDKDIEKNINKYDNATSDYSIGAQNLFSSNAMYIGGLVGLNYASTIEYSYNKVNVANKESLYAGGIIGLSIQSKISDTYVTGSVYAYEAIGGLIGLATDNVSSFDNKRMFFANDALKYIFTTNTEGSSSIAEIYNVVISNIWKYSHLNPYRNTIAKPNATDAQIGMLVGQVKGDIDKAIGSSGNFESRVMNEKVYYKLTYTYETVNKARGTKLLVPEIGSNSQTDEIFNLSYKLGEITAENIFTQVEHASGVEGTYSNSLEYLLKLTQIEEYNELDDQSKENYLKDFENKGNTLDYFKHINAKGVQLISGKFRNGYSTGSGENDQTYYTYSRMSSYGSFRTLTEIYERKYNCDEANKLYKEADLGGVKYEENENPIQVTYEKPSIDNTANEYQEVSAQSKINRIYSNWDSASWYGLQLNVDGERTEKDYVFPALKSSKDIFTIYYIYNQEDLKKIKQKPESTFILMNDIYMTGTWEPICGENNPFKGVIRSAVIGDRDGDDAIVYENNTYTIYGLNINIYSDYEEKVVGLIGYAEGAIFENFNIHLTNISVQSDNVEYVGTLAGYAKKCTFNNVSLYGGTYQEFASPSNKQEWVNLTQEKIEGVEKTSYKIGYAHSKGSIVLQNTIKSTISVTNPSFIGGLIGRSEETTISDKEKTRIVLEKETIDEVENFKEVSTKYLPTISVNKIQIITNGYGYKNINYNDNTIMTYYVGGIFGDVEVVPTTPINSEDSEEDSEKQNYYSFVLNSVEINSTYIAKPYNEVKTRKSGTYSAVEIRSGIYIGGLAGRMSGTSITSENLLKGIKVVGNANIPTTATTVTATVGTKDSIEPLFEDIQIGGLIGGLENIGELTDIEIKNRVNVNYVNKNNSSTGVNALTKSVSNRTTNVSAAVCPSIGGIIGKSNTSNISYVLISEDINVNAESYDSFNLGGIIGTINSCEVNNVYSLNDSTINVVDEFTTTKRVESEIYVGGISGKVNISNIKDVVIETYIYNNAQSCLYSGGIAGYARKTNISNTYVEGMINTSEKCNNITVGGIVGMADIVDIAESINNINIVAEKTSSTLIVIGSIVGRYLGSVTQSITNTYSTGNIELNLKHKATFNVGGLVGRFEKGILSESYAIGSIYFTGPSAISDYVLKNSTTIGGIVGYAITNNIQNCYFNVDHVIMTNNYGTGLTTEEFLYTVGNSVENFNNTTWLKTMAVYNDYYYPLLNSWLNKDISEISGIQNILSEGKITSINDRINSVQALGTKASPQKIGSHFGGTNVYDGSTKTINGSVILISDGLNSPLRELNVDNAVVYYKNADYIKITDKPLFNMIKNSSIINGLKVNSNNSDIINYNNGYIVNSEFLIGDEYVDGASVGVGIGDVVVNNNGLIINCDITYGTIVPKSSIIGNITDVGMVLYCEFDLTLTSDVFGVKYFTNSLNSVEGIANIQQSKINVNYISGWDTFSTSRIESLFNQQYFSDCILDWTYYPPGQTSHYILYTPNYNTFVVGTLGATNITKQQWVQPVYYKTYTDASGRQQEADFGAMFDTQGYDLEKTWLWTESYKYINDETGPVSMRLRVFEKDHFNDPDITFNNYWKETAIYEKAQIDKGESSLGDLVVDNTNKTIKNIDNAEKLAFALYNYTGYILYIEADISLYGKLWTPIDNYSGTILGNGHTISDFMIAKGKGGTSYYGIFGNNTKVLIEELTFRNITVVSSEKSTATKHIGSIAGATKSESDCVILNKVGVQGFNVFHTKGRPGSNSYMGTLIGSTKNKERNLTITDCYASLELNSFDDQYNVKSGIVSKATEGSVRVENYYVFAYHYSAASSHGNSVYGAYRTNYTNSVFTKGILTGVRSGDARGNLFVLNNTGQYYYVDYAGANAEIMFTNFDFILDWTTLTNSTSVNDLNIDNNFGLPVFLSDVKFWWDIDKISEYTEDVIRTKNYIDNDGDGVIDNFWIPTARAGESHGTRPSSKNGWFEIYTAEQLTWFMKQWDSGAFNANLSSAKVKLMANIDLYGKVWTPIGAGFHNYFCSEFDGNGKVIGNLTSVGVYEGEYNGREKVINKTFSGLFGTVDSAKIYDFKFAGRHRITGTGTIGVLAGYINNSEINTVSVAAEASRSHVTLTESGFYAGGIAGIIDSSTVFNCAVVGGDSSTRANIIANSNSESYAYIGGIVGSASNTLIASINVRYVNIYNNRIKSASTNQYDQSATGGIAGMIDTCQLYSCKVDNSQFSANVNGGGIVGFVQATYGDNFIYECAIYGYLSNIYGKSGIGNTYQNINIIIGNIDTTTNNTYGTNWYISLNGLNQGIGQWMSATNYSQDFNSEIAPLTNKLTSRNVVLVDINKTGTSKTNNLVGAHYYNNDGDTAFLDYTSAYTTSSGSETYYIPKTTNGNTFYINPGIIPGVAEPIVLSAHSSNLCYNWSSTGEYIFTSLTSYCYDSTNNKFRDEFWITNISLYNNLDNLIRFRSVNNKGKNIGLNIRFTNSFTAEITKPLGNEYYAFGNSTEYAVTSEGNTITLNINNSGKDYIGLFGKAYNLKFENLSLTGNVIASSITYSSDGKKVTSVSTTRGLNVGALVGYLDGGKINNVSSSVNVTGNARVGGLVGYSANKVSISGNSTSNIEVSGTVTSAGGKVVSHSSGGFVGSGVALGGLVGFASRDTAIQYVSFTGTVQSIYYSNTELNWIGGFVGFHTGDKLMVSNCNMGGTITTPYTTEKYYEYKYVSDYVGGIVGCSSYGENSYIKDTTLNSSNSISGQNYVGSFAGKFKGDMTNLTSTLSVYGYNNGKQIGGIVGEFSGTIKNCVFGAESGYDDLEGRQNVGGIVGLLQPNSLVENCTNYTSIGYSSGGDSAIEVAGGIVGCAETGSEVLNCTNYASIGTYYGVGSIGGIVGTGFSMSIEGCTVSDNDGGIINFGIATSQRVGGIVGNYYLNDTNSITYDIKNNKVDNVVINAYSYGAVLVGNINQQSGNKSKLMISQDKNIVQKGQVMGYNNLSSIIGYSNALGNYVILENIDTSNSRIIGWGTVYIGGKYNSSGSVLSTNVKGAKYVKGLDGAHISFIRNKLEIFLKYEYSYFKYNYSAGKNVYYTDYIGFEVSSSLTYSQSANGQGYALNRYSDLNDLVGYEYLSANGYFYGEDDYTNKYYESLSYHWFGGMGYSGEYPIYCGDVNSDDSYYIQDIRLDFGNSSNLIIQTRYAKYVAPSSGYDYLDFNDGTRVWDTTYYRDNKIDNDGDGHYDSSVLVSYVNSKTFAWQSS